jgi:beta-carotene 15,15'-dioxygenase
MKIDKLIFESHFWTLSIGLLFVLLLQFLPEISPTIDYIFFLVFVIFIGIPHGAIDHLIEKRSAQYQKKSFSLINFLAKYLIQMGFYGLLWWFFPSISLLIFLILSAWHFGESDLQPAPQHIIWKFFQISLGGLVLFYILMREPHYTGELIDRITLGNENSTKVWYWCDSNSLWIYSIVLFGLLVLGLLGQKLEPLDLKSTKWAVFLFVMILIYWMPLLPAFAFYFGGWHALNTFEHMGQFLGENQGKWKLWKSALPFTLLAMLFLGGISYAWFTTFSHIDPLPILFIFIAIITLPHLLVMAKMFSQNVQFGNVN